MLFDDDNLDWRWDCGYPRHEHLWWDEADFCAQLRPLLAALQCASEDSALGSLLPLMMNDRRPPVLLLNPDEAYVQLYSQVREIYESAGRPEGRTEADLWNWISKICPP